MSNYLFEDISSKQISFKNKIGLQKPRSLGISQLPDVFIGVDGAIYWTGGMVVEQPVINAVLVETMTTRQTAHLLTFRVSAQTHAALLAGRKQDAVLVHSLLRKRLDGRLAQSARHLSRRTGKRRNRSDDFYSAVGGSGESGKQ